MITLSLRIPQCMAVVTVACVIAAGGGAAADSAAYWPQFHGPNRDSISEEKSLLQKWPEGGPGLVWTAKGLGHGFSTVSIAEGSIYTAGNIEDDTIITALDMGGAIRWQVKNGKAWTTAPAYPGTRGTPTVNDGRVYHESPHGNVICLDAKTGETVWELNILDTFNAKNIRWALAESLLIDGDNVICNPGGPQASLVALNKRTGAVVWKAPSTNEAAGYASPILFEHEGLRIIAALTSRSIIGVNADTGQLLWQIDHESYTDQNTLMPIFHEGELFVSTIRSNSAKWKVRVENGGASLEEVWRTEDFDNHHGGVVLVKGNIYGTSTSRNRNKWICLDWETGEIEHMDQGVGKGSCMYADGMLYTLGENGTMGLVRPTTSGHETVSAFSIPEGGEGKSWAHPVVTGGRLYIRHGAFLYSYDVRG